MLLRERMLYCVKSFIVGLLDNENFAQETHMLLYVKKQDKIPHYYIRLSGIAMNVERFQSSKFEK